MKDIVEAPITPPPSSTPVQKPRVHPAYYVALILVVGLLAGVYFLPESFFFPKSKLASRQEETTIKPTPTHIPTPRPIPHGPLGFTVGQSDRTVPQISRGTVDPYYPEKGSTQSMTIQVNHTQPVTAVVATVKTDNGVSQPYPFTLVDGTSIKGTWKGSWTINDSYLYTYAVIFTATSGEKTATVEVTMR